MKINKLKYPPDFNLEPDKFWFSQSGSRSHKQSTKAICTRDGKIHIEREEACKALRIPLDKTCEQTLGNFANAGGLFDRALPARVCEDMRANLKTWKSQGFAVDVKSICSSRSCYAGRDRPEISIGQCTETGAVCAPTPAGISRLVSSKFCKAKMQAKISDLCTDSDGHVAKEGECFNPSDVWIKSISAVDDFKQNLTSFTPDEKTLMRASLSDSGKFWKCHKVSNLPMIKLDKECCEKNGGHYDEDLPWQQDALNFMDFYSGYDPLSRNALYSVSYMSRRGPKCRIPEVPEIAPNGEHVFKAKRLPFNE